MSKKEQTAALNEAWRAGVRDGRVVRFFDGARFKLYPSRVDAIAAVVEAKASGIPAEIVVSP